LAFVCTLVLASVCEAKIGSLVPIVELQTQSTSQAEASLSAGAGAGAATPLTSQYWLKGLENLVLTACTECPKGKRVVSECTIADDTVCGDASYHVGRSDAEVKNRATPDGASNIQFVDTISIFNKDCKITKWKFYSVRNNELQLQVWRPQGGPNYMLVGETTYVPTVTGVIEIPLTGAQQITAKAGDVIGWRHQSNGVIPFDTVGGEVRWEYNNRPAIGNVRNFNGAGPRTYSISADCDYI